MVANPNRSILDTDQFADSDDTGISGGSVHLHTVLGTEKKRSWLAFWASLINSFRSNSYRAGAYPLAWSRPSVLASIFLAIFALVLILPGLQKKLKIFPVVSLHNVGIKKERPPFSWSKFKDGSYQQSFESWLMKNSGLWGTLVRSENQINFSLFGQVSSGYTSTVLMGKDRTLFERVYVDEWNGKAHVPDYIIEERASKLKILQDLLAKRGVAMFVLVSPSKAVFESSLLPASLIVGNRDPSLRSYERAVRAFENHGINFLDSTRFLNENRSNLLEPPLVSDTKVTASENSQVNTPEVQSLPSTSELPLFPKSGTHWNQIASCAVTSEMVRRWEILLDAKLQRLHCTAPVTWSKVPKGADRDLATMVNVWKANASFADTPYPRAVSKKLKDITKPNVLFVGTSFLWPVLDFLDKIAVYNTRQMYFYYQSNYFFDSKKKRNKKWGKRDLDISKIDWEKDIFSNQLIVFEANEAMVHRMGLDFLDDAIAHAKK